MSAADSPLLRAYDAQLRGDAEVLDAREVDRDGPIVRAVFDGAWGFVGYRSLAGYDGPADGGRLDGVDLAFVGGGQDAQQIAVANGLERLGEALGRAVAEDGMAILAVCGGYQLAGHGYTGTDGTRMDGIAVLDAERERWKVVDETLHRIWKARYA